MSVRVHHKIFFFLQLHPELHCRPLELNKVAEIKSVRNPFACSLTQCLVATGHLCRTS
jgi:hypothetical protein